MFNFSVLDHYDKKNKKKNIAGIFFFLSPAGIKVKPINL